MMISKTTSHKQWFAMHIIQHDKILHWCETVLYAIIIVFMSWNFLASYKLVNMDPIFQSFSMSDEAVYAWQAEKILKNPLSITSNQINEYHPPLFPIVLALGKTIQKHTTPVISFRNTALTISVFSLVILYILSKRISGHFLGLLCLIGMMEFPAFFTYKFFILNDILLMLLTTVLLLFLHMLKPNCSWKIHCAIGLTVSLAILSKWTGAILIPFTCLYYVLQPSKSLSVQEFKKFIGVPVGIIFLTVFLLFLRNLIFGTSIIPSTHAFSNEMNSSRNFVFKAEFWKIYIFAYFFPFIATLLFFLIGTAMAVYKKNKFLISLLFLLIIGILGNLMLARNDTRYVLYLQPAVLILTGAGIETCLKKFFKKPVLKLSAKITTIIFYIILTWYTTPFATDFFLSRICLLDYASAGDWIKKHATHQTAIFSAEPRSVRYFTGFDYANDGGNIKSLPATKQDLKNIVKNMTGEIILEINMSRESMISDLHPFSAPNETKEFLHDLGFDLKKEFYIMDGVQNIPVIKIFKKTPN